MRGKDHLGTDLIIARDYLTSGMRERAAELVDIDLGPRSVREIEQTLRAEVEQERLTSIDRALLRGLGGDRVVAADGPTALDQTLRTGRLSKLARLGLAESIGAGRWRLTPGLGETLKAMGDRGDIIRTMQRAFTQRSLDRPPAEQAIYDPASDGAAPLVGRVIARGLADEHADRHYLIVDATDGRSHYVAIGKGDATEPMPNGAIVRIEKRHAEVRAVDRTVAAIAAANDGRYDVDAHLRHDPGATQGFAETHVRRLESLRRASVGVARDPAGTWTIAPDHLDRVAAHEKAMLRDRPVAIELLSVLPLEKLVDADAATWLDREAMADAPTPIRDAAFGHEVQVAQARRAQWLVTQGLADERSGKVTYRPDMLSALQRRELLRVAGQLSDELALPFGESAPGARIEGLYRRRIDLAGGRFALVERARDFTLVPWRPVLEARIGKPVSGIMARRRR